jgi:hypothetical protein
MSTYTFFYKPPHLASHIECELEYEPAERGAREYGTGLQLEPDYDESIELQSAKVMGIEIGFLLSDDVVKEIEQAALASMKEPAL